MKKVILAAFCILNGAILGIYGQDTAVPAVKDTSYWKLSGISGLNFSQTALVNWVAGGENAISGNVYLNGSLDYAKEKWAWDNDMILEFGMIYTDENDWRKNVDKISFTTKLGYQINKKWYYSLLGDFNSQFAKGYNYPNTENYISNFLAPGYSNLALGIDFKPNDRFSIFYSPISTRFLIVNDDSLSNAGAFGIDPGDRYQVKAGSLLKATAKQNIMENVDLISSLDMFTPYDENFGNIDTNWELMLSFKINKFLTATLNTTLRYYDKEHYINSDGIDEGPKVQFKELFGMGFAYKF